MNKVELIAALADKADVSKKDAAKVLDSWILIEPIGNRHMAAFFMSIGTWQWVVYVVYYI